MSGSFGRLWGRGHETLLSRRILSVSGTGAATYLQGLVTSDLFSPPTPPTPEPDPSKQPGVPKRVIESSQQTQNAINFNQNLRATCFLDHKGRIVTDSLLWKVSDEQYIIDCPGNTAETLLQHLKQYKLRRSKVTIQDVSQQVTSHVIFGTLQADGAPPGFVSGLDPRHPSLGVRILKLPEEEEGNDQDNLGPTSFQEIMNNSPFPESPDNYELVRRLAGVAEGEELQGRVALEANQEFLNAVSFHKGCYLGQELTARVHHTGVLRKRIMPLLLMDTKSEIPQAWNLANSLQEGRANKKFTQEELKTLPSRLPRLSILTAGHLVALMTGSVEPSGEAIDDAAKQELEMIQASSNLLLREIETSCQRGAKITKDGKTIGQIVSEPVKGTNIVLALMRMEEVGLLAGGVWSKLNKVKVGDSSTEFRYLPYLPLWFPEIDSQTGKAKDPNSDEIDPDARTDVEKSPNGGQLSKMPRIIVEEVPISEKEANDKVKDA